MLAAVVQSSPLSNGVTKALKIYGRPGLHVFSIAGIEGLSYATLYSLLIIPWQGGEMSWLDSSYIVSLAQMGAFRAPEQLHNLLPI